MPRSQKVGLVLSSFLLAGGLALILSGPLGRVFFLGSFLVLASLAALAYLLVGRGAPIRDAAAVNHALGALQSLILTVAVLVGGLWTLYSFRSLHEIDLREMELKDWERRVAPRFNLDVDVSAQQGALRTPEGHALIRIGVVLHNTGNMPLMIDALKDNLKVAQITRIHPDGGWEVGGIAVPFPISEIAGDDSTWSLSFDAAFGLDADQTRKLTYLTDVPRPGLYLISFWVPQDAFTFSLAAKRIGKLPADLAPPQLAPDMPNAYAGRTYLEVN